MPIQNIIDFYSQSQDIVSTFNNFIEKHKLQSRVKVDHYCYKCGDSNTFESIRKILENESDFIYQSIISQRRIAIVKLRKGIETILGPMHFLELSDQKPDNSQINSFDHIEIYPINESYENLVSSIIKSGENVIEVKRPHHTTYDLMMSEQFSLKFSRGPLIEKIKTDEIF